MAALTHDNGGGEDISGTRAWKTEPKPGLFLTLPSEAGNPPSSIPRPSPGERGSSGTAQARALTFAILF
jgi:hypothetical protein